MKVPLGLKDIQAEEEKSPPEILGPVASAGLKGNSVSGYVGQFFELEQQNNNENGSSMDISSRRPRM